MKFRDMSTEMTEQEIITALYMICPDSLYKHYKREKGYISVWYSLPNDTETDKHHLELLPDNVYIFDNGIEQELSVFLASYGILVTVILLSVVIACGMFLTKKPKEILSEMS